MHIPSGTSALAWVTAIGAASTLVLGCGPPDIDIDDRKLAEGRFSGLRAVVTDAGTFAVALKDMDADGGELTIVPLDGQAPCSVGKADRYVVAPNLSGPRMLAFGGQGSTPGTEWFQIADLACHAKEPALTGAPAPLFAFWIFRQEGSILFVSTAGGSAFALDPSRGTSTVLSQGASAFTFGFDRAWFIEQGELVGRDFDGNEVARLGSDATDVAPIPDGSVAFVDASGLQVLKDPATAPVLVDAGACEPLPLGGSPLRIGFLSPCAERRLVVADLDSGERTELAPGVSAFVSRGVDQVVYIQNPLSAPSVGDLWVAPFSGGQPRFVAGGVDLWKTRALGIDTLLVLADDNGTTGRLGAFDPAGGFVEWLPEVAEFKVAHLSVAALGDYNGQTGTLYLRERAKTTLTAVATGVPAGGFAFSSLIEALGYLHNAIDGAGRLDVRVFQTGQTISVDDGVTEFVEVPSLETPGVAYTIDSGPRAGIWFGAVQ